MSDDEDDDLLSLRNFFQSTENCSQKDVKSVKIDLVKSESESNSNDDESILLKFLSIKCYSMKFEFTNLFLPYLKIHKNEYATIIKLNESIFHEKLALIIH